MNGRALPRRAAFDRLVAASNLQPLITQMKVPWQVVGGVADELSPTRWVDVLAARCPAPTSVTRYAGARHSMTEAPAVAAGPNWRALSLDWLHDRVQGKSAVDGNRLVTTAGEVIDLPPPVDDTAP